MEIRRCGAGGLRVSSLGLGTLMWGRDTEAHEAEEMLSLFLDAGGTLLECAPEYGSGHAADVVAHCLKGIGRRNVVITWRGGARSGPAGTRIPSAARGDLLSSLDEALARIGTDHVDLWLAGPDPEVHLEETLEALEVAWRSGRARYVGLSHRSVWDTAQAVWAGTHGSGPVISAVEEEFSLLTASTPEARELRAAAISSGVGYLTHSPLAGGVLTGKYRHMTPPDSRAASEHLRHTVAPLLGRGRGTVEALAKAAEGLDRSMTDVALTWAQGVPGVVSTIVGPRTVRQLEQILDAGAPLPEPIRVVLDEVASI